ncbi:low-specificity L-threonine aldolase [Variovorax boronicumulans]
MNACVDLRSDTVTRPTVAMYEAMQRAPVGDDTYGEDPTVNALQARIAGMLGFEAAMFVSSGTQANLCAVLAHCGRGDEYIVGQMAHCYRWEAGGAAMFGGVQPQPLDHAEDGTLPLAAIADAIKPDNEHFAVTRLLALENTLGGRCLPDAYLSAATGLARQHGLSTHLDGARLFNAATAADAASPEASARRIAGHFDSVSVCFSKGLGAPVGSALCGSAAFIARARRVRKAAGGAMRQAGVLAAAALHALDHHVERLAEDHRLARLLYEGVCDHPGVRAEAPQTNIVFLDLVDRGEDTARALQQHLQERGVLVSMLYGRLRLVTHRDVDEAGALRALDALREFLRR